MVTSIQGTGSVHRIYAQGVGPERGGIQEGPSLGCPVPVSPHPPAVHDDGARTAPVAFVHLPEMKNGPESQRTPALNTPMSTSLSSFLPHVARTEREEHCREE